MGLVDELLAEFAAKAAEIAAKQTALTQHKFQSKALLAKRKILTDFSFAEDSKISSQGGIIARLCAEKATWQLSIQEAVELESQLIDLIATDAHLRLTVRQEQIAELDQQIQKQNEYIAQSTAYLEDIAQQKQFLLSSGNHHSLHDKETLRAAMKTASDKAKLTTEMKAQETLLAKQKAELVAEEKVLLGDVKKLAAQLLARADEIQQKQLSEKKQEIKAAQARQESHAKMITAIQNAGPCDYKMETKEDNTCETTSWFGKGVGIITSNYTDYTFSFSLDCAIEYVEMSCVRKGDKLLFKTPIAENFAFPLPADVRKFICDSNAVSTRLVYEHDNIRKLYKTESQQPLGDFKLITADLPNKKLTVHYQSPYNKNVLAAVRVLVLPKNIRANQEKMNQLSSAIKMEEKQIHELQLMMQALREDDSYLNQAAREFNNAIADLQKRFIEKGWDKTRFLAETRDDDAAKIALLFDWQQIAIDLQASVNVDDVSVRRRLERCG